MALPNFMDIDTLITHHLIFVNKIELPLLLSYYTPVDVDPLIAKTITIALKL